MNRYYICDNCDYHWIVEQKMADPLKKKCPECGKMKLYQDLTGQHTFVYQEPKTLGHLAERNNKKFGKYTLEEKRNEHGAAKRLKKKRKPWYNKEGKDLTQELSSLNTPEKKHKYIMDGK